MLPKSRFLNRFSQSIKPLKLSQQRSGYWEARNDSGEVVMVDKNPIQLLSSLQICFGDAITVIISDQKSTLLTF